MKKKIRCVYYLPRRLYRVIDDISPLFLDMEIDEPKRGAQTRALEHIIQQYMESEDFRKKLDIIKVFRWKIFLYMSDKRHKLKAKKN